MKNWYKIVLIILFLLMSNTITWFLFGEQKIYQEQYEKILKYTPYLTEQWWNDIYVLIEDSSISNKISLPDYGRYHPLIISDLDSFHLSDNNHLLIIQNVFYNPFFNKVNVGYWWLGTDAVSDYYETYIWIFFDWLCIHSDKNIKNRLNEILYKTPIIFGNSLGSIEARFGNPIDSINKIINDKEIKLLIYDGLQVEGWNNMSDFYHDESSLFQLTKISVTDSEFTKDLPFQIGENINKATEFLGSKFLTSKNDSTLVFEKKRDDFNGYENHKFIIKFNNEIIEEFEWIYGEPYNLEEGSKKDKL
jgi:hypothetical protein